MLKSYARIKLVRESAEAYVSCVFGAEYSSFHILGFGWPPAWLNPLELKAVE